MKLLEQLSSHMQKVLTFTSYHTQESMQMHHWPNSGGKAIEGYRIVQ